MEHTAINKRTMEGMVVSDKMQKTRVVAVVREVLHTKYQKRFKVTKKYKAHDENNEYHTGDKVVIEAAQPMSREKRWRIIKKVESL